MGSTRLPGKVLQPLGDDLALGWIIRRCREAQSLDDVIVATSDEAQDEPIVDFCRQRGVNVVQGHESDVLQRYCDVLDHHPMDAVVRITGDCPLTDPDLIDEVVGAFRQTPSFDCVANTFDGHYPRGTDVFLAKTAALLRAAAEETRPYGRVHVTPYLRERTDLFTHKAIVGPAVNYRHWRWTLDEERDLHFLQEIYQRLGPTPDFSWRTVKALLDAEPELHGINAEVRQKETGEL